MSLEATYGSDGHYGGHTIHTPNEMETFLIERMEVYTREGYRTETIILADTIRIDYDLDNNTPCHTLTDHQWTNNPTTTDTYTITWKPTNETTHPTINWTPASTQTPTPTPASD